MARLTNVLSLILIIICSEGVGQAASEDNTEQLYDCQDAATASEDDEDVGDVCVESLLHHKETSMNVDLLDDDTNIGDLKQILTTSRSFKQAAGVRNRLLGGSHEGVFPVSVSLVVTISSTTQELTLDSVPLVPEITLDRL